MAMPGDNKAEAPRYIDFECVPAGTKREDGSPVLNRWSSVLTRGHDFPGAQVRPPLLHPSRPHANTIQAMLYAAGVPNREMMKNAPHVGISTVWWEGNPCNMHLHDLGKVVKQAVIKQEMLAWQFNTIGVSDAITMGGPGKSRV